MSNIPAELKRFLLTNIPSVPHMEAALLLHSRPGRSHSAAEIASRLYMPEQRVAELLRALSAAGILLCDDGLVPRFRFEPSNAALDGLMATLAQAYATDLEGVTDLIHDASQTNAHRFADAYKLRKDR